MTDHHAEHTEKSMHAAMGRGMHEIMEVSITPRKSPVRKPSHDPQKARPGTESLSFNYEDCILGISHKCDEMQQQMIVLRQELFQTRKELLKLQRSPAETTPARAVVPPVHEPVEPRSQESQKTDDSQPVLFEHEHEAPDSQSDISSPEKGGNAQLDHIMAFSKNAPKRPDRPEDLIAKYPCVSKYHAVYSDPKLHASTACRFCSRCHLLEKLFNQNDDECGFKAHVLSKSRLERQLSGKPLYLLQQAVRRFDEYQAGVDLEKTTFGDV
ncbi:hypothetical protein XU18_3852 [Perkinsela sp. CCAP 1560/4]|nr:hypothetical protein XU18_3890 [Perkinsela sp. CCAP 1560/4]KNH05037.1 hypothetical protein XU18_3852 [Perkinsela sp. CCAP 1560/4]|eukprot:KNH05016.1 hypothetical protein XU18_3890 [Perkinsela sp. CCAP 1560/4]